MKALAGLRRTDDNLRRPSDPRLLIMRQRCCNIVILVQAARQDDSVRRASASRQFADSGASDQYMRFSGHFNFSGV